MADLQKSPLQIRVKERMDALEKRPATLAKSLGYGDSFIRDILRKGVMPGGDRLNRLADALETTPDYLLGKTDAIQKESPKVVPIAGKAGAGPNGGVLFAKSDEDLGEADAPINATPSTRALQVEGTSMRGIAEDGSLIFYDEREPPNENHAGELCICWLEDERVLIKYPYAKGDNLWDLESTTASTLRDVAVRYFAHVTSIVPRRAAKRLIRRNSTVQPVDTIIAR